MQFEILRFKRDKNHESKLMTTVKRLNEFVAIANDEIIVMFDPDTQHKTVIMKAVEEYRLAAFTL